MRIRSGSRGRLSQLKLAACVRAAGLARHPRPWSRNSREICARPQGSPRVPEDQVAEQTPNIGMSASGTMRDEKVCSQACHHPPSSRKCPAGLASGAAGRRFESWRTPGAHQLPSHRPARGDLRPPGHLLPGRAELHRIVRHRLRTYTAYSIGCAVVWAVILAIHAATASNLDTYLLIFGGFFIGWLSATIARYVYPPPKSRRSGATDA
jgi:hypothetical protein